MLLDKICNICYIVFVVGSSLKYVSSIFKRVV